MLRVILCGGINAFYYSKLSNHSCIYLLAQFLVILTNADNGWIMLPMTEETTAAGHIVLAEAGNGVREQVGLRS